MKKRAQFFVFFMLFLILIPKFGQAQVQSEANWIPTGAKIFIANMGGFENYMTAALRTKNVAVLVVARREDADFEMTGQSQSRKAGAAKIIFGSGLPEEEASVQVTNLHSGVVVWAHSSHKGDALRGKKSTSENIAKHLTTKVRNDTQQYGGYDAFLRRYKSAEPVGLQANVTQTSVTPPATPLAANTEAQPKPPTTSAPPPSDEILIAIESDPPGAEIEVDNNFVGTTPSKIALKSGKHLIALRRTGYTVWAREMHLTKGSDPQLKVSLSKE